MRRSSTPQQAIPRVLNFYRRCSFVTGVFLLLLCAEMLIKYGLGYELEFAGRQGMFAFVPNGTATVVNLSTGILIVHGWFYVVYLVSDLRLWSAMRWPLGKFLLLALGGIVPFLSFFLEVRVTRQVRASLVANSEPVISPDSVDLLAPEVTN